MTDTYDDPPEPATPESIRAGEERVAEMKRQLEEQKRAKVKDDPREILRERVLGRLEAGMAPSKADAWAYSGMRIAEAAMQARDDPSYTAVDYKRNSAPNVDARGSRRKR